MTMERKWVHPFLKVPCDYLLYGLTSQYITSAGK